MTELPPAPLQTPPALTQDEWRACHAWIKYANKDDRMSMLEHAVLDAALRVTIEHAFPVGAA